MKKGLRKFLAKKKYFPLIYKAGTRQLALFYQQYIPIFSVILGILFGGVINYYFDQMSEEINSIDEDVIYYPNVASESSLSLEPCEEDKIFRTTEGVNKNKWQKVLPAFQADYFVETRENARLWRAFSLECRSRVESLIKKMCDNWLKILVARYFYLKRQMDEGR